MKTAFRTEAIQDLNEGCRVSHLPNGRSNGKFDTQSGRGRRTGWEPKPAAASGVVVNLKRVPKGPGGVGETWDVAVLVSNHQLVLEFRDR